MRTKLNCYFTQLSTVDYGQNNIFDPMIMDFIKEVKFDLEAGYKYVGLFELYLEDEIYDLKMGEHHWTSNDLLYILRKAMFELHGQWTQNQIKFWHNRHNN